MIAQLGSVALLLHIIGVTIVSTGTLGGLLLNEIVWRTLERDSAQGAAIARVGRYFGPMSQAGAVVMLASGLLLLATRNWAYVGQTWLTIKFGIYILLWLNGLLVARPAARQFGRLLPYWLAHQSAPSAPSIGMITALSATGGSGNVTSATASHSKLAAALADVRSRMKLFYISQTLMLLMVLVLAVFKFR